MQSPTVSPPILQRRKTYSQIILESENKIVPGQFLYIDDYLMREKMINAWNAINELNMWDFIKQTNISTNNNLPEIHLILHKMESLGYTKHTPKTFISTLREIQYIAVHSEHKYISLIGIRGLSK